MSTSALCGRCYRAYTSSKSGYCAHCRKMIQPVMLKGEKKKSVGGWQALIRPLTDDEIKAKVSRLNARKCFRDAQRVLEKAKERMIL